MHHRLQFCKRVTFTCLALCLVSLTLLVLTGCQTSANLANTKSLSSLQDLNVEQVNLSKGIGTMRFTALRDTALSLGARGGLAWRAKQLNRMLNKQQRDLSRIFNFNALLLDDNVLPPVLIEGRTTLNLPDSNTIRLADRAFVINRQARFVTLPPTWRDYIWMKYGEPSAPDRTLLPRNQDERAVWKAYIQRGWEAGIGQANVIFAENLGRLKRDFNGMIRYRTLLAQHMVSPPFVARTNLGITGNGHEMNVNDRLLRITALPMLQSNGASWKTEIVPNAK